MAVGPSIIPGGRPIREAGGSIARKQAKPQGFGMTGGRPQITVSMQRDADGAAEIAHQIEQPAGIRHLLGRKVAEREPRRRQQAQHDRRAAHHLRPEHAIEIGLSRRKCTQAEADAEYEKSGERQQPRIDRGVPAPPRPAR